LAVGHIGRTTHRPGRQLPGRLDAIEPETAVEVERIDKLRSRIKILMDEIEISRAI